MGLAMTIAAGGAFFTSLPAAAADGFTLKDKPKIAMLYFGPKNDGGWTQAFDEARVKIEKEIGQKIQFVENVPEDASAIKPAAEKFI
ncbi:BMP family ABC transporter substrate-binding protein, partial [Mycobacterium tuberculosis]